MVLGFEIDEWNVHLDDQERCAYYPFLSRGFQTAVKSRKRQ
jgi:hypothetical protein